MSFLNVGFTLFIGQLTVAAGAGAPGGWGLDCEGLSGPRRLGSCCPLSLKFLLASRGCLTLSLFFTELLGVESGGSCPIGLELLMLLSLRWIPRLLPLDWFLGRPLERPLALPVDRECD